MESPVEVREYYPREGAPWNAKQAAIAGPELERIRRKYRSENGPNAWDVLHEASDPKNPLHPMFEWDNLVAANEWRLEQARSLCHSIRVRIIREGTTIDDRPLMVSIRPTAEEAQQSDRSAGTRTQKYSNRPIKVYVLTEEAQDDADWGRRAVEDAKRYALAALRKLKTAEALFCQQFPATGGKLVSTLEEFKAEVEAEPNGKHTLPALGGEVAATPSAAQ